MIIRTVVRKITYIGTPEDIDDQLSKSIPEGYKKTFPGSYRPFGGSHPLTIHVEKMSDETEERE